MSAALAACVANVHGSAPLDASPDTTPDVGANVDVRPDVTPSDLPSPIDLWSGCDPATGLNCPAAPCGNGRLDLPAETCDDGNMVGGDGCSRDCKTETDWICTAPGKPCSSTVACGDGLVGGSETCDDHNQKSGDGCSEDCKIEPGWICPAMGARCLPICGDGMVMGGETCDDGNDMAGDGCSDACRAEPVCMGTSGCASPCGDGLKLLDEECDDGNTTSGDGCSADCKVEPGWDCQSVGDGDDGHLRVPVVFRDFMNRNAPGGHPNFEPGVVSGVVTGMVQPTLGPDREPRMTATPPANAGLTTAADFDQWYHDSSLGKTVRDTLVLDVQPNGTYVYDHSEIWNAGPPGMWTTPPFFPLDDRGWAAPPNGPEISSLQSCDSDRVNHNYSFTSEARYWFAYQGGETLDFIGDDDVWVFVNGQLAVDLGGVHRASAGSVTLDAAGATRFGLTVGRIYEIAVFQAERHVCNSSYKLTVGKFSRERTVCLPRCGDGIVNGREICDDGVNDGSYGGCLPGCGGLGPFCGDGKVDAAGMEACDDGRNLSTYGQPGCGPGCRTVPRCGDGKIDGLWGEECDDGNTTSLDGCTATCKVEVQ